MAIYCLFATTRDVSLVASTKLKKNDWLAKSRSADEAKKFIFVF
jgi:hypothetical protein